MNYVIFIMDCELRLRRSVTHTCHADVSRRRVTGCYYSSLYFIFYKIIIIYKNENKSNLKKKIKCCWNY